MESRAGQGQLHEQAVQDWLMEAAFSQVAVDNSAKQVASSKSNSSQNMTQPSPTHLSSLSRATPCTRSQQPSPTSSCRQRTAQARALASCYHVPTWANPFGSIGRCSSQPDCPPWVTCTFAGTCFWLEDSGMFRTCVGFVIKQQIPSEQSKSPRCSATQPIPLLLSHQPSAQPSPER